jgi:energy-coupling factor transport system permease protein
MTVIRIFPATAGLATISSLIVIATVSEFKLLVGYAAAILVALLVSQGRHGRLAGKVVAWTLPLFLPLILIHGFLNRSFPIDFWLLEVVPVRTTGLAFASLLSLRMLLISIVGSYWLCITREDLVESLLRLKLPSPIILFLVQGVGTAKIIATRVDNVYLAQRARGVPVGGSFRERLRAFPSVLLPVIIGTLVEADARVPALVSQGYGSLRVAPVPAPSLTPSERILLCLPPVAALAVIACTWA